MGGSVCPTWPRVRPHPPPRARVTATARGNEPKVLKFRVHCGGVFPLFPARKIFDERYTVERFAVVGGTATEFWLTFPSRFRRAGSLKARS
jgi:hypothetical protein